MDKKEITDALATMFRPGDVFEIRLLDAVEPGKTWTHTAAGYFDYAHIGEVPNAIANYAAYGGCYVSLNPVNPDLLARANNRIVTAKRGQATSDADIVSRRWLFVDIDATRPAGISSTDEEHMATDQKASAIIDGLATNGFTEPVQVDSGNGSQLLYPIDLPADDGGLVQRTLKALIPCNTEACDIDQSVYNAARIIRLPGTMNCKGDSTEKRPHRMARTVKTPAKIEIVPQNVLEAFAVEAAQAPVAKPQRISSGNAPGDQFNEQGDVRPTLIAHGWTNTGGEAENEHWCRPEKTAGTSATFNGVVFYVFTSGAPPFEPMTGYSPFAVLAMLEHGGDYAAANRALEASYPAPPLPVVDLSAMLAKAEPKPQPAKASPGDCPDHLFDVPGLMGDVMAFAMASAPYPNKGLAFAGALALMSFLTGRRVQTTGGLRGNIYLCALAGSGTGKDYPRKINTHVLRQLGEMGAIGDKFASGEGLQDAMMVTNRMLFQNDEFDSVLRQISADTSGIRDAIPATLLTFYTSADSIYPMRRKAGQEATQIDQPHMTMFATATPKHFYQSLSERLLTNGLFARLMILDIGKRGKRQMAKRLNLLPQTIIDRAKAWQDAVQQGNMAGQFPEPRVVDMTLDAETIMTELTTMADVEWDKCQDKSDECGQAVWARCGEHAEKLALLYACSKHGPDDAEIDAEAARWGVDLATFQTRRMLWMAEQHVAQNPFHAECLKVKDKIRKHGGRMLRRDLLKRMHLKASEFEQIVSTLMQQDELSQYDDPGSRRGVIGYELTQV